MGAGDPPATVIPIKKKWFGPSTFSIFFPLLLLWVLPEKYAFFVWLQAMTTLFCWFLERTGRQLPQNEFVGVCGAYAIFFFISPVAFASYFSAFLITFTVVIGKAYPTLSALWRAVDDARAELAIGGAN